MRFLWCIPAIALAPTIFGWQATGYFVAGIGLGWGIGSLIQNIRRDRRSKPLDSSRDESTYGDLPHLPRFGPFASGNLTGHPRRVEND